VELETGFSRLCIAEYPGGWIHVGGPAPVSPSHGSTAVSDMHANCGCSCRQCKEPEAKRRLGATAWQTPWFQSRLLAGAQRRRHLRPGMNWAVLVEQMRPIGRDCLPNGGVLAVMEEWRGEPEGGSTVEVWRRSAAASVVDEATHSVFWLARKEMKASIQRPVVFRC
jgi:hypothetical protein